VCGRAFQQIDFAHGFWINEKDICGRHVFADELGYVIISDVVIAGIHPSISSALKLSEIEVR
jgi:hypothetical protein